MIRIVIFASIAAFPACAATSAPALLGISGVAVPRAGVPISLTAGSSSCSPSCTLFSWVQVSGPTTLIWNSRTSATPTVRGAVLGEYQLRLTVSNALGTDTATGEITFGAAASDVNGIVVGPAWVQSLAGRMKRFGTSPWPTIETSLKTASDHFGAQIRSVYWPSWRTSSALGVASFAAGSAVVTGGAGANFPAQFNCNGTDKIVIEYIQAGVHRWRGAGVSSCPDATHLVTDVSAYDQTAITGIGFWRVPDTEWACWVGQSTNCNYYDVSLAHWTRYRESGSGRAFAVDLARLWAENPWWDWGLATGGSALGMPRIRSLRGIMMLAQESEPDYWTRLTPLLDRLATSVDTTAPIGDLREDAYDLSTVQLAARWHPDGDKRTAYRAAGDNALTKRWIPQQRGDGTWLDRQGENFAGSGGLVSLVAGSPNVTSAGLFASWHCNSVGYRMWFAMSVDSGDPDSYACTFVDASHITLDRPYAGTTSSKKFWVSNAAGRGTNTFMHGIAGRAMIDSRDATQNSSLATAAQQALDKVADWLRIGAARKESAEGIYFILEYPTCKTGVVGELPAHCDDLGEGPDTNRGLQFEVQAILGEMTQTPARRSWADRMMGVLYAAGGGPSTAGGFTNDKIINMVVYNNPKWPAFVHGIGGAANWGAAREGTPLPETLRTVMVEFSRPSNADSTTITVTDPGRTSRTVSCPSSPCQVQIDDRQGGEGQVTLTYKLGALVVASAQVGLIL